MFINWHQRHTDCSQRQRVSRSTLAWVAIPCIRYALCALLESLDSIGHYRTSQFHDIVMNISFVLKFFIIDSEMLGMSSSFWVVPLPLSPSRIANFALVQHHSTKSMT